MLEYSGIFKVVILEILLNLENFSYSQFLFINTLVYLLKIDCLLKIYEHCLINKELLKINFIFNID